MTEDEILAKIASDVLHEVLMEERQQKRFNGCPIGSPNPADPFRKSISDPNWNVDEWMVKVYRVEMERLSAHELARLEHIQRVRGYNC